MEARKWEELPMNCLVNVLGRVGVESLLGVPFVCKSWYKATLNPFCWKQLGFPHFSRISYLHDPFIIRFKRQYRLQGVIRSIKFVKVAVDRSAGCATMVELPACYKEEALTYVADKCPALKKLVLHSEEDYFMWTLSLVIGKFKHLESLEIKSDTLFEYIVTTIGVHCENFVALSFVAVSDSLRLAELSHDFFRSNIAESDSYIGGEEAMAIVNCLPNIKFLTLRDVFIKRENLIEILKGCVQLVHLDVRNCRGFDEDDEELLKLASHIPTFKCSGSVLGTFGDDDDDDDNDDVDDDDDDGDYDSDY